MMGLLNLFLIWERKPLMALRAVRSCASSADKPLFVGMNLFSGSSLSTRRMWHVWGIWIACIAGMCLGMVSKPANAQITVEVSKNANKHELQGIDENGEVAFTLPLFQEEGIQYFSAGVGIEERGAIYPPFRLKLVLVAGERAFLASASVKIQNDDSSIVMQIPEEDVTGPWVYVDLPPGSYSIIGKYSDYPEITKHVSLQEQATTKVILRWPMP